MSTTDQASADRVLTPADVGALYRVDRVTVKRWAREGRLNGAMFRTPGGHYRFHESAILALLNGGGNGGQP